MNQRDGAARIKCGKTDLSKIEQGKAWPRRALAERFVALGICTAEQLRAWRPARRKPQPSSLRALRDFLDIAADAREQYAGSWWPHVEPHFRRLAQHMTERDRKIAIDMVTALSTAFRFSRHRATPAA